MRIIDRLKDALDLIKIKYVRSKVLRKRWKAYYELHPGLRGDLMELDMSIYAGVDEEAEAIYQGKMERRQQKKTKRLKARREELNAEIEALQFKANTDKPNAVLEAEVKALERKRDELKRGGP